jgi:hemerythrin superfamily protein
MANRTPGAYVRGRTPEEDAMNAVKMLKQQHRQVEKLFKEFENAKPAATRRKVFEQIADALAVHATIEERHFYPGVKTSDTEDILLESVEEHLEVKRVIADLLGMKPGDENFDAKVKVLQEDVDHHVEEEETELFPKVEKLFDEEALEAMGVAMQETQDELVSEGNPRDAIPGETDAAAPL